MAATSSPAANLGLMLRDGRGVPVDLVRAEACSTSACKGAVPFACTNAGDLDGMLAKANPAGSCR